MANCQILPTNFPKKYTPLHLSQHSSNVNNYSYSPLCDLRFASSLPALVTRSTNFSARLKATPSDTRSKTSELASEVNLDDLGFKPVPTDYMFVMKCEGSDKFSDGELQPFGEIELNPFSSALNYGQGLIEGLKAYKKEDDSVLLFRPEANALRMRMGADRMCMPAPTVDQFVEAVKATVSANKRWIPSSNKGFLHIRPLLLGSGPVLSLKPSLDYIFLIIVSPVKNYFESGAEPINLVVENAVHRAVPGGVGNIKAIGNYAMIMNNQDAAKGNGFDDVLYLDAVHNKYLEEISTANIFIVKEKTICTPDLRGTILPGITRESIVDIALSHGFQVEERLISVEELYSAEEVFCTGNAVGLLPVGTVTYQGKRLSYRGGGHGTVSWKLSSELTNIQMGLTEDKRGWTFVLK
ncbi:branched-chain amino acid aminotransferase 2, chloroplastic-like [Euphorbia lathyris]|uniref:branched-chain amino acid aminotransferase 2, chloroplastic-like n=1 Tax=Euphorbia lathyris TaxID=212925 RepID=UPI0033132550